MRKKTLSVGKIGLLSCTSLCATLFMDTSSAQSMSNADRSHSLTVMAFNIWNNGVNSKMWDQAEKSIGNLTYNQTMQDLLRGVAPDVLVMPELYNNTGKKLKDKSVVAAHVQNTLGILNTLPGKLGNYQKNRDYDSREGSGMVFARGGMQELGDKTIKIQPANGFPDVIIEGRHLNYYDAPTNRIVQAKELVKVAKERIIPTITAGDFNAADISERGLLSVDAQIRLIKSAANSKLYKDLSYEYLSAGDETKAKQIIQEAYPGKDINNLSWKEWGEALEAAYKQGKDTGLKDETYPVEHNLPVTLNILKQQYQLVQLERHREQFKPSELGDGRSTWTSDGEDATNTWPSWDRSVIDHIMVSRPFAKWVDIVDNGKWSGTLSEAARLPNGNSLSDHEPVAQELRWIGPELQTYKDGEAEKTRLVWGDGAYDFSGRNKEFYLTRNNNRDDVYLGQISDSDGNPILGNLTIEEKKTLLNCQSNDSRFQQSIKDYCIDDHSFIGETLVKDGGTIIIDEDAALGGTDAKLRLANGGLRIAGSAMHSLDRSVLLEGPGWFDVAEATNNVSLLQEVNGAGMLVKRGSGSLTLNAANSYTGGTSVQDGILRAGVAGAFVDNTNYQINGGELDLNGFGLKMASLSGSGGTLQLGSASLQIDQSENTQFDGNIIGNGDVAKSGSGWLALNGNNTYTGTTTVFGGGLIVGDANHPQANLPGEVRLEMNTVLRGIGTLGGLYVGNGGTVAPGNSIGTLTVNGNLTLDAGSTYEVEIDPSGASDKILVGGAANLSGAQVNVVKAIGNYEPGQRYTILSASNGINGNFNGISQNMPFIDLGLSYDPTQVYLDVSRNEVRFTSVAQTNNQRATAKAIESVGAGNNVYDTVVLQDSEANARLAFDALSGEIHASTKTALINDSAIVRNAASERIRVAFGEPAIGTGQSTPSIVTDERLHTEPDATIWGRATGSWSETGSDGNATKLKQSSGGFILGYDASVAENWRLGALAGYSKSQIDINNRHSSSEVDSYHTGIYAGGMWDSTSLKLGLAYSWHSIETDRNAIFPSFREALSSDYDASTLQAFGELSHRFDLEAVSLEPFANLAVVRLKTDAFRESGGNASLSIANETTTTTFTTIGARASSSFVLNGVPTKLAGALGWQHAYGDRQPVSTSAFATGSSFIVSGAPVAKDTLLVDAGLEFDLSKDATLGVKYIGQYGSGYTQNGFNANLNIRF